jgi:transglutaminase-like putative cysteine protease
MTTTATTAPSRAVSGRTWTDTAVVLVLAGIGMVGFGTAFDSWGYLIAGLGGLVLGAAAALLSARLGFGVLLTAAVGIVVYYLFGSAVAIPTQASYGVVPTLDSLTSLTIGAVNGWADLVTLRAPVSLPDYVTAVPYVSGWVVALVSVSLAARWLPRRPRTAWRASLLLVGPVLLYLAGVLLGTDEPYFAGVRGIAFAVLALVWLGWRRRDGKSLAVVGSGAMLRRKLLGTATIVVVAVVVGAVAGAALAPPAQDRFVLRDQVQPPFEPLQYPSPLAGFRQYTKDLADSTLFTVTGLQSGELLRLATMDTYNGVIWGVAGADQSTDSSGAFQLVGRHVPPPPFASSDAKTSLDVTIDKYSDVWIPDAGYATSLSFVDAADANDIDNVRYNAATGTAVVTTGLKEGAEYKLDAELQTVPDDAHLKKIPVASFAPSPVTGTPDPVVAKATEIASHASSPIEKLRAVQQFLATTGYFSHGTASDQVASRAGHGADRMYDMVTLPNMVGDQEQYASLFALMARSFNYPVRVVVGFAPKVADGATGPVKVTGNDVTAWAEVAFQGVGWVPFFPTPKNPDVPQSQVPKPQSEPQPQVRQPPRTNAQQDDLITAVQIDDSDKAKNNLFGLPGWVIGVGIGTLIPLLIIFVPLLVIGAIKTTRMRRRRAAGSGDAAAAGAWDELLDRFLELGYVVPVRTTRVNVARGLQAQLLDKPTDLGRLARQTDSAVFSGRQIDGDESALVWTEAMATIDAARDAATGFRRLLSRYRVSAARRWAARLSASAAAQSARTLRTKK